MGTQIQYKSSFPGYCFMRNLNEDADRGGWPVYHGDKMLMSSKNYTSFLPRPDIDGNSEYDREVLKQTMLMHEATFKNQVVELHRLYKIQRELMEELKAKEARNHPTPMDASQSVFHSSSSQMAFEETRKMWDNSGKSSCSRPSFSGTGNLVSPTKLEKDSSLHSHTVPNGSFIDNRFLDSNTKKFPRRMFDLQLPADEYVDDEDRERFEQEKVFTVAEGFPSTSRPIPVEFRKFQSSEHTRGFERESEICGTEMSKRREMLANQNILRSGLVPDIQITYPAVPSLAGSGSSSFSSWKSPTSMLIPSSNNSAQLSKISEMSIKKNVVAEPQWHLNGHSNTNFTNGISYPNEVTHGSQNEFSTSEKQFPSVGFDYLNCSRVNESTSLHFENSSTRKYFKGLECMDVETSKDLNLNVAIPNGSMGGMVPLRENMIVNEKGKSKEQMGGLPWLRMKPDSRDGSANGRVFCLSQGYSHQSTPKVEVAPNFIQDSSSTSIGCNSEDQGNQKSDSISGTKILGFPIFDNTYISKDSCFGSSSKSLHKLSDAGGIPNCENVRTVSIDLTCDQLLHARGQTLSTENGTATKELDKGISGVKFRFNLNACADEEEPELDLESPADPETSEVISREEEYQLNQHIVSSQSSQAELQDSLEDLTKSVAEAIVMISSSDFRFPSEAFTSYSSETALDSLHWFADIVSNHTGLDDNNEVVLTDKNSCDGYGSSSDDSDYFEKMTLKLIETKPNEYLCKPWAADLPNEDEACASSSLPTRRRRGQAKRGRQRKDFQKDILPGISSLSRQEVSEDIQAIGGLMRAIGHPWQTGLTRRNAAKNGWGRGRKRTRNVAPPVAETIAYSPPRQKANTGELGLEERSLTGWGKTTRRPRRQRFATGNISIPITQV